MKKKLQTVLQALVFCVPFAYLLLCSEYFDADWLRLISLAFIMGFSIICGFSGKLAPMLAGGLTGGIISVIITVITRNTYDNSWFSPFNAVAYSISLSVFIYFVQVALAAGTKALINMIEKKYGENKKSRKIAIALMLAAVIICFSAGTCMGYIAGDFEKNGIDSAEFSETHYFDETENIKISNISAKLDDNGDIVSESERLNIGSSYYATVGEMPQTGTLVLYVHERLAYYSPFDIRRTDFSKGNKNDEGEYETMYFPHQYGTDKEGRKIELQFMGGNKISTDGIKTTEYLIADAQGNYLTAKDFENVFPINVTLEGHTVKYERESLF